MIRPNCEIGMKRLLTIDDAIAFIDALSVETGSGAPLRVLVARRDLTDADLAIAPGDLRAARALVRASAGLWGEPCREILIVSRFRPPEDGAAIHETVDRMETVMDDAFALVPYNDGGVIHMGAYRPVLRGLGQAAAWFELDRLPMLSGGGPSVARLRRFLRALIRI